MAKLGSFVNVSNIRGKLGGQVYTRGRSGATLRLRVKGTNPRTSAQTNVRAQLTAGSRFAKGLTSAQVTNWKSYALSIIKHNSVSGAAYSPSWITAVNNLYVPFKLMSPAGSFPVTPPSSPFVGDTITVTSAGSSGSIIFTGSAQQGAGIKTFALVQKLKNPNRTPSGKAYRIGIVAAIPVTPFQITASALTAGTYATAYKFGLIATGQESGLVVLGNVVVT